MGCSSEYEYRRQFDLSNTKLSSVVVMSELGWEVGGRGAAW
jgi:hypothetical protein